jgi:hypothetical protein
MSLYTRVIQEEAKKLKSKVDPRHVEAWMRLEWGTLDHLPRGRFRQYVKLTDEIERQQPGASEDLARSYGL